jgi:hypothetical protein
VVLVEKAPTFLSGLFFHSTDTSIAVCGNWNAKFVGFKTGGLVGFGT